MSLQTDITAHSANESEDERNSGYIWHVESYTWVAVGSIILLVGTVGNILVIIVIARRQTLRSSTNGLYLLVLALVDLLVLYTGLLRNWIFHATDIQVRDLSEASCKIHVYLTYGAAQLEAWILINLTLERVVAVFWPHRARVIFTQPRALVGLALTTVGILLVNIPFLVTFGLAEVQHSFPDEDSISMQSSTGPPTVKHVCVPLQERIVLYNALCWVDFAMVSAVPFSIMALSNTAIVVRVLKTRKKRKGMTFGRSGGKLGNPTCLLLTVTTTFIICTAPYHILLSLINNRGLLDDIEDLETRAWMDLLLACLALLNYINYCINFVLYCLTGTRFRREFVLLCTTKKVAPLAQRESRSFEYSITTLS